MYEGFEVVVVFYDLRVVFVWCDIFGDVFLDVCGIFVIKDVWLYFVKL